MRIKRRSRAYANRDIAAVINAGFLRGHTLFGTRHFFAATILMHIQQREPISTDAQISEVSHGNPRSAI
jgi:hypothetical protein